MSAGEFPTRVVADGKIWVVRVEVTGSGVIVRYPNCRASVERSGALLLVDQATHTTVSGYALGAWWKFVQFKEYE